MKAVAVAGIALRFAAEQPRSDRDIVMKALRLKLSSLSLSFSRDFAAARTGSLLVLQERKGLKGTLTKGTGKKNTLKVKKKGIFRVFSGIVREFQGVFRVFFPHLLCGYPLRTLISPYFSFFFRSIFLFVLSFSPFFQPAFPWLKNWSTNPLKSR